MIELCKSRIKSLQDIRDKNLEHLSQNEIDFINDVIKDWETVLDHQIAKATADVFSGNYTPRKGGAK
jgi:hypothetical protein